jgi:ketosteroid isomerase-like protein
MRVDSMAGRQETAKWDERAVTSSALLAPKGGEMSRAEIEGRAEDFSKVFATHDAAAMAAFYTADAKFLAPNVPMIEGRAGIEAFGKEMFAAGGQSLELQTLDVLEGGDLEVEVGRYTMGIQPPGGDPMVDNGKYVAVWRRDAEGGLRMAVDTFNSDAPLA